jgi:hypothetical protein
VRFQHSPSVALAVCLCGFAASAQEPPRGEPAPQEPPPQERPPETITVTPTEPAPPTATTEPAEPAHPQAPDAALLDGHVREGAFLAGPGSLTSIVHHTLLAAAAGVITQGIERRFEVDQFGTREAMLAGALIGAGIGFGISAWWQFHHWIDTPMARFAIVNSIASGLFFVGFTDLFSHSPLALSWAGFLGAELGAWLTATLGGGEMPVNHGLLIASGAGWGLIYSALLLGIVSTSGTQLTTQGALDTMAMATGIGAAAMALATMRFKPTTLQIIRADAFGAGVGGAVFLLSALVLGFNFEVATPYVLGMVASAGAIAAVTLLWEEAAERPPAQANARYFYRSKEKDRRYASVWW